MYFTLYNRFRIIHLIETDSNVLLFMTEDRSGMDLTEAEDIKKRIHKNTQEELYKKSSS